MTIMFVREINIHGKTTQLVSDHSAGSVEQLRTQSPTTAATVAVGVDACAVAVGQGPIQHKKSKTAAAASANSNEKSRKKHSHNRQTPQPGSEAAQPQSANIRRNANGNVVQTCTTFDCVAFFESNSAKAVAKACEDRGLPVLRE